MLNTFDSNKKNEKLKFIGNQTDIPHSKYIQRNHETNLYFLTSTNNKQYLFIPHLKPLQIP